MQSLKYTCSELSNRSVHMQHPSCQQATWSVRKGFEERKSLWRRHHLGQLAQQVDGSVAGLPGLLGPLEAVVHAPAAVICALHPPSCKTAQGDFSLLESIVGQPLPRLLSQNNLHIDS